MRRLHLDDPGVVVALIAGLSYAAMGLFVGLGALAPRQGAMFLNVEDAEEIREQRASLGPSAVSCILIGAFLLLLALAPAERGPNSELWVAAAGACLLGVVVIGVATRRRADELMRQISLQASALTLNIALLVLSVWALLAQLDFVSWVTPRAAIAGVAAVYLVTVFWVSGRRGLLAVR